MEAKIVIRNLRVQFNGKRSKNYKRKGTIPFSKTKKHFPAISGNFCLLQCICKLNAGNITHITRSLKYKHNPIAKTHRLDEPQVWKTC
jgi:isoprenylcysteine carboxyl methyltransferase (ICMT) family protein YpbQ